VRLKSKAVVLFGPGSSLNRKGGAGKLRAGSFPGPPHPFIRLTKGTTQLS